MLINMLKYVNNFLLHKKDNKNLKWFIVLSILLHVSIYFLLCKNIVIPIKNVTNFTIFPEESVINDTSSHQSDDRLNINKNTQQHTRAIKKESHVGSSPAVNHQSRSHQSDDRLNINKNTQQHTRAIKKESHVEDSIKDMNYDQKILKNLLHTLIEKKNFIDSNPIDKLYVYHQKNNEYKYSSNDHINNEISLYKNAIIDAIRIKLYNISDYFGKECNIKIQLASNGKLISAVAVSGDSALCQAAIVAINLANIPAPPNLHIYKIFKNITLNFTP